MGAGRTDHTATVEQTEGSPAPPGTLRGVLRHALIKSFAYKIKCLLKNIVLLYSTGSHANALDAGL